MTEKIKIGWLFPNTFNLHGERGNILALEAEAKRRGYGVEITQVSLDSINFTPLDYDFLFCSPGEMEHFPAVIDYLEKSKDALISYAENHPMLVTGTSVSLFGTRIHREDNTVIKGLGIIDVETYENPAVYGDDLFFRCQYNGKEMEIIGSQIQMMNLDIKEESPFGRLIYGYGNTGKTKFEGVMSGKGIFTNTLGPILVCNPWLTEEILNLIECNRGWPLWEEHRDNTLELRSLKTKVALINKKETRLIKIDER